MAAGLLVATPKQVLGWECGGACGKSEQLPQCPFLQLTWHQIFELDEVNRKHAICRRVIFIDNLFNSFFKPVVAVARKSWLHCHTWLKQKKKMWHLSFASYFPLFFHKLITLLEIECHQRQSKQNKGKNCSFFFSSFLTAMSTPL